MATVFTIGYEGTDITRFLATLKVVGIECVADVRAVTHSRKKGFSKKSLSALLNESGIEYQHFLPLGDPKPGRDAARAGDYETFRSVYSNHLALEDSQASLEDLLKVVEGQKTCLLCFERDPKTCHRSIIAQCIVSRGHESFELMVMIPEDTNGTLQDCRVAVLVKALPHPSHKNGETVCCAGVTLDGTWKRLYPVRFRHLSSDSAFKRWHWVDYRYHRPTHDARPESCHVHEESIAIGGELPKAERSRILEPIMVASTRVATNRGQSLALLRPQNTRFYWKQKSKVDLASEVEHIRAHSRQASFLYTELPDFEPTPYEFRFKFRDAEGGDHDCENGDWEAHAMDWRWSKQYGSDDALKKMGEKFNDEYPKLGMAFAQGTIFKRSNIWTLLGVIRLDPYLQPDLF